jgi:hypothetical protein
VDATAICKDLNFMSSTLGAEMLRKTLHVLEVAKMGGAVQG